jgi:hypothetical protein
LLLSSCSQAGRGGWGVEAAVVAKQLLAILGCVGAETVKHGVWVAIFRCSTIGVPKPATGHWKEPKMLQVDLKEVRLQKA